MSAFARDLVANIPIGQGPIGNKLSDTIKLDIFRLDTVTWDI